MSIPVSPALSEQEVPLIIMVFGIALSYISPEISTIKHRIYIRSCTTAQHNACKTTTTSTAIPTSSATTTTLFVLVFVKHLCSVVDFKQ